MENICCKIVMFTLDVAVVVCIVVACLVCGQINLWDFHFSVLEKLYRFLCGAFMEEMNWKRMDIGDCNVCVKAGNACWTSHQTVKLSFGFGLAVINSNVFFAIALLLHIHASVWLLAQLGQRPNQTVHNSYVYLFVSLLRCAFQNLRVFNSCSSPAIRFLESLPFASSIASIIQILSA